ncbi:DsbA family protein [Kordiimonas sp. SCSIO 12610]|uniref:DsbA family protein n=1 Tax=Kordiimonas sp. SCSIO 12610 TaxID=2829597 RepID=UPI00210A1289|nr:DsbA family protein [Kordiimonas sp. SCSIO 12610]UTW54900.1 DsbA family protein [Kordiimonas sp. SCSIO 12610]
MGFESLIKMKAAQWLTSERKIKLERLLFETGRRLTRRPREVIYFHRVDDPYCQLMVQVLPEFSKRFGVKVIPKVVERLPADMYPDPARFEAYSILDASRLARLYGAGFPYNATVPDRLAVGMAHRFLASVEDNDNFFGIAEEIGEALWQRNLVDVQELTKSADLTNDKLTKNEQLLRKLGHYASATLYYGGEFYFGLDRLDHLERRLNDEGCGDGEVHFELQRLWRHEIRNLHKSIAGRSIELFFSVRSPYSYLGLEYAQELAAEAGVSIRLKPVLPMLMRGMKVPSAKGRYILNDVAREARVEGIRFGKINDPLGLATKRAMALGFATIKEGYGLEFFTAFTRGVWSQGIDGTSDDGLKEILKNASLSSDWLSHALPEEDWMRIAETNQRDMLMSGSWGVPTFRVGNTVLWGQDRMWAVLEALKQQ